MGVKNLFIFAFLFLSAAASAQTEYTLCGKSGNCSMTWDEFMSCKKELVPKEKNIKINSFIVMIATPQKKDTIWTEYVCKAGVFSKSSLEAIEKLHGKKKMGSTVKIDAVEVLQSGRDARKTAGMIINLK